MKLKYLEKHKLKVKKCCASIFWGSEPNNFNYMRNSIFDGYDQGFVFMQVIRMVNFVIVLLMLLVFVYIYGIFARVQLTGWMLLTTALSFLLLIIGGGK